MASGYYREWRAIFKKRSEGEGVKVFNVKGRRGLVEKSLSEFKWAGLLHIFS